MPNVFKCGIGFQAEICNGRHSLGHIIANSELRLAEKKNCQRGSSSVYSPVGHV